MLRRLAFRLSQPWSEADDLDRQDPLPADAVRVQLDAQDPCVRCRAARWEYEVAERPSDQRPRGRPRDRPQHVRVRAKHDPRPGIQARGGKLLLPAVGYRVQLGAPVEEADDDVGVAACGAYVRGDPP